MAKNINFKLDPSLFVMCLVFDIVYQGNYRKVASSRLSRLVAHFSPYKNGASPILPSSIARNSSALNAKIFFEIL